MVYCVVDSVERDDATEAEFEYDSSLGWLHTRGGSWHTVMGSPVVREAAGQVRPLSSRVVVVAAIRERGDA